MLPVSYSPSISITPAREPRSLTVASYHFQQNNEYGNGFYPVSGEIDIMQARGNGPSYPKQFVSCHLFLPTQAPPWACFIPWQAEQPETPRDLLRLVKFAFPCLCLFTPVRSNQMLTNSFFRNLFLQRPKLCDKWSPLGPYSHAQHGSILQDLWVAFHAPRRLFGRLPYLRA
jgi:hypothetical protein